MCFLIRQHFTEIPFYYRLTLTIVCFLVQTTSHWNTCSFFQPTLTIVRFLVQTTSLWRTCSFIDWPWQRIVFSTERSITLRSVPCMFNNYLLSFRCEWVKSVKIMFKHIFLCFIYVINALRKIYHCVDAKFYLTRAIQNLIMFRKK